MMQEQLSLPMIIVIRGHTSSSTGRSKIAAQLTNYTKFPLIDQDDISKSLELEGSFPSTSIQPQNDLTHLSFKVLHQIASTQLRSNRGVIINSALSNRTHLDQLNQLAESQGADLILIQCRPPDEIDDYDVGGGRGRKLSVDTTEPFHVEEFVSEHLPQVAALQPKTAKPDIPKANLIKTPSLMKTPSLRKTPSLLRPRKKVTQSIHRHLQALTLLNNPKNEDGVLYCKRCRQSIPGPYYHCLDCDDYIFHKSCAEDPSNLELVRKKCPDYLKAKDPKGYRFPEKYRDKCNLCEGNKGFSPECHDCLFQANMKGNFLPIVVNHVSHAHPLNLIIMPTSVNYEYGCYGCGEFGKSISYRCYDCNINLHIGCVLLPRTTSSEHHIMHTLKLSYDALDHNYWDKSYCDVCNKERNPEQWFYSCSVCDTVTHIACASPTD